MLDLRLLLRRYGFGVWRHRWAAIAVAWVLCLGGWAATWFVPNVYEADARLYVDADAVLTPLLKGLALDNTASNQLEVLQRTLLSRPNLETLISKTDLDLQVTGPAEEERLVARLAQQIKLVSQTSNLFTITYQSTSPHLALDVVRTILNIFIETKAGNTRSDMDNARQFLQQQIDSYEQQLREAERKRAEFKTKYVDLLPSDASGVSRLEEQRATVHTLEGQLTDTLAKQGRLQEELATTPQMVVTETDAAVAAAATGGGALAAAEDALQQMLVSDTDANPEVIRQRRLVARLRASSRNGGAAAAGVPARSRSAPNEIYAQLKVELVNTDGEIASLRRQVADATRERDRLEQIARSVPGLQAQYVNLDRDYDVVRKNYDQLIARREEMRLASAADSNAGKVKLQIVDPPQLPRNPVGPKRVLLLTGVLLVGLAGGVGLAAAMVQLDRAFYSLEELRGLGLPIAGSVSLAVAAAGVGGRKLAGAAAAAIAVLLLCGVYGGLLLRVLHAGAAA